MAGEMVLPKGNVPGHSIRWYARFVGSDEDWTPATASMVRSTFGWDVRCSCGWETNTGGGVERWLRDLVWQHKFDAANGLLEAAEAGA